MSTSDFPLYILVRSSLQVAPQAQALNVKKSGRWVQKEKNIRGDRPVEHHPPLSHNDGEIQ